MPDGILRPCSSSVAIATDTIGWRGWDRMTRRKVTPSWHPPLAMEGRGHGGRRREGVGATEKAVFPHRDSSRQS